MTAPERPDNGLKSETLAQNSVALFDVDNTLIRGFSVFMFADHLVQEGLFDKFAREKMQEDYERYQNGETNYREFAIDVVNNYSAGLKGQSFDNVVESGRNFVDKYRKFLLPHADELLKKIKPRVKRMIAVSGAPLEAFMHLAQEYGFDEYHLLEAEVVDGIYSGQTGINMALDERKKEAVKKIGPFNTEMSFAFGDSIHDFPILSAVGNPFVVGNREEELTRLAISQGWSRVDESTIINAITQRFESLNYAP